MPCKLDPTIVAMRRLENLKLLARRTGLPALKKAVKAFTGDPPEPDDPAFSLGRYVMAGPGLPDSRGGWTHTDSLYDVRELLDRLLQRNPAPKYVPGVADLDAGVTIDWLPRTRAEFTGEVKPIAEVGRSPLAPKKGRTK